MALPPPKTPNTIPIEIPAEVTPVYSNMARIAHAPSEFVTDFALYLPGDTKAVVMTRVISAPIAFKLFVQAINENLARYEATFGVINIPAGGPSLADSLFKPFHGPPEPPKEPPEKPQK